MGNIYTTCRHDSRLPRLPSECAPIQGTCDAVIYDKDRGFLLIADYKDGRVKVESADNAQLLMYASAFIQMNALGSFL
jgi:ATP-dependent exoDNAse (exonuclease V) beta subunit